MEEVYASREPRNLLGFEIETEGSGYERRIAAVRLADGGTLERDKRYLIAFNTFDSPSAGHRFMKLRALLETAPTRCTFHPVQTRDAVIDYFRRPPGRAQDSRPKYCGGGVNLSEIAVENDRRFGCVSIPCAFSESRQSFCYRLSILAGRR